MALLKEDLIRMSVEIVKSSVESDGRYALNNPDLTAGLLQTVYDKLEELRGPVKD